MKEHEKQSRQTAEAEAVIFDLDGTLWDSADGVAKAWNQVLESHEEVSLCVTADLVRSLMGKTLDEIGSILFPDAPFSEQCALLDEFGRAENVYLGRYGGLLYEGLEIMLKDLSGSCSLFIVSNCQEGYVAAFLQSHHLEKYFKDYEESGRTGRSKTENIRLIMERNGISKAVYVGDTMGDEAAAKTAGIPFIHAAYGFGDSADPDGIISSPAELPLMLRS